MADKKKPIDWIEIERDYRTGAMSIKEMARWYGLSDTAINKRAKAGGWVRENHTPSLRKQPANNPPPKVYVGTVLTPENATPDAIVGRGRNLVLRMLDELDASTSQLDELHRLIEIATDAGDQDNQRQALMQAVSLKQRAEVLKSLATAAKTLSETTVAASGGKKAERQEAAQKIGGTGGKFAPPAGPGTALQ